MKILFDKDGQKKSALISFLLACWSLFLAPVYIQEYPLFMEWGLRRKRVGGGLDLKTPPCDAGTHHKNFKC